MRFESEKFLQSEVIKQIEYQGDLRDRYKRGDKLNPGELKDLYKFVSTFHSYHIKPHKQTLREISKLRKGIEKTSLASFFLGTVLSCLVFSPFDEIRRKQAKRGIKARLRNHIFFSQYKHLYTLKENLQKEKL